MKVRSIQGLVLAGAAVALLAGCVGEGADMAAPAPPAAVDAAAPAAQAAPVARPAPVEPAAKPSTEAPKPKPKAPVFGAVSTTPALPCEAGTCTLPAGPGTVTIRAEVTGAHRVEFFLVPTGNETWEFRRSLGVDRDGSDGWSVTWSYSAESLLGHLTVVARGPGGEVWETPFRLYHE